jgi:WD40 repeat protein
VAFSPDGRTVAAAGDSLRLYDVATGQERLRIDRRASHLHFDGDGKTLTGTVDGAIYRWDAATGKSLTPEGSDGIVRQMLVTPDGGRIVTNTYAGEIGVWDGATGNRLRVLKAGWGERVVASPDGRRLAWAVDSDPVRLRLFDLAADRLIELSPSLAVADTQVVAFTADGKTVVTLEHQTGTVRLWDVETGKERRSFPAVPEAIRKQPNRPRRSAASPDGKTLAVACDEGEQGGIRDLGRLVEPPDTIRLWDIATGKELRRLDGNRARMPEMAFSPDGRLLVTGDVWDVATGRRVAELTGVLPTTAFSCDGRSLATAGYDGTIRILETATWTERTRFRGQHKQPTALAFTPAGQLLCGGIDTTVLAHDVGLRPGVASGTAEAAWTDLTERDARRAFEAQGRLLATPSAAVRLFAETIKAVEPADADRLRRLIAELGDARFAVREAASKALAELGEKARPAVAEAARASTSPEVAERARKILGEAEPITPEQVPQVRAIEVLERIASDDAKKLLTRWAAGVPGAVLTEESRAALGRLDRVATRGR